MVCLMKVIRSEEDGKEFGLIRVKSMVNFAVRSTASLSGIPLACEYVGLEGVKNKGPESSRARRVESGSKE